MNQEQLRLNSEIGRLPTVPSPLSPHSVAKNPGFDHLGITQSCEEVMNDMPFRGDDSVE